MAALGRFIMDTAQIALAALSPGNESKPLSPSLSPLPSDVLKVKHIFLEASSLPLEIIDIIIDHAEYWPFTSTTTDIPRNAVGNSRRLPEDILALRALPLGYCPADAADSSLSLPLKSYPTWQNVPHLIESSAFTQAVTSDVLDQWKKISLPRGDHPCRKVVFTIKSKDQGWADGSHQLRGTYKESYTWFDVGLEQIQAIDNGICTHEVQVPQGFLQQVPLELIRGNSKIPSSIICDLHTLQPRIIGKPPRQEYDRPSMPHDMCLQINRRATKEVKEHIIVWSYNDSIDPLSPEGDRLEEEGRGRRTGNGEFVRNLQFGDIITVWARARFPQWSNQVKEMKIDVYWAV